MAMKPTDNLIATARGSADQAKRWASLTDAKRISDVRAYIDEVFRLAPSVGLDPAIVVAQSAHETANWTSTWWANRLNPAGIGITGDPAQNAESKTWDNGTDAARAQVVHLALYAGVTVLPYKELDPRFDAAIDAGYFGIADTLNDLTRRWATDTGYAAKVAAKGNVIFPTLPDQSGGTPVATPTIYDLKNDADAARFGLSPAERNTILAKRFANRVDSNGVRGEPRAIVVHIQDGNTIGSLNYWLSRDASSTVMIQRDGSILRVIPEQHGPWTNGDVKSPTAASAKLRSYGGNLNIWSLTIENEGAAGQLFTDAQFAANVWQIKQWQAQYGIPNDQVIRHADINTIDKARCPGDSNFAEIMALLAGGTTPTVPPVSPPGASIDFPEGMDLDLATAWFGSVKTGNVTYAFNPEGPVSKLWLTLGRYPALSKVETYDERTYFRFGDGTTIWRPNANAPVRVLE